jgi:hypothetical protein
LPANANHERRGSSVSQPGTRARRLADARSNSSLCAACKLSGSAVSWLPASISFCKAGRWPSSVGKWSMALSVSVSQRKAGGSEAAGTWVMRLALKPTMCKAGQSPSTSGSAVKSLSEANSTCNLCRRGS